MGGISPILEQTAQIIVAWVGWNPTTGEASSFNIESITRETTGTYEIVVSAGIYQAGNGNGVLITCGNFNSGDISVGGPQTANNFPLANPVVVYTRQSNGDLVDVPFFAAFV